MGFHKLKKLSYLALYSFLEINKFLKRKRKRLPFSSFPYSGLDVPWVPDILIPFMIDILSRRVIASNPVWVCFWKLILDANSVMYLGLSSSTLPAVHPAQRGPGVRRVHLCSLLELVEASVSLLSVSKMGIIILQRTN